MEKMRDSGNLENKVLSAKEGKKTQYVLYNLIYPYKILFLSFCMYRKRETPRLTIIMVIVVIIKIEKR